MEPHFPLPQQETETSCSWTGILSSPSWLREHCVGPSRSCNLLCFQGNRETTLQYEVFWGRFSGSLRTWGAAPHPEPRCRNSHLSLGPWNGKASVWTIPQNPGPFLPFLISASGTITHAGTRANHLKVILNISHITKSDSSSSSISACLLLLISPALHQSTTP